MVNKVKIIVTLKNGKVISDVILVNAKSDDDMIRKLANVGNEFMATGAAKHISREVIG